MVIWFIGLSGSGKTTLASEVLRITRPYCKNLVMIDGDVIRETFNHDLGYTLEDRRKNADRVSRMCKFLNDQGLHVLSPFLSVFPESRDWNKQYIKDYYEVYIECPYAHLIERDPKGLYQKALRGELKNMVGIDIEFIAPKNPDLVIENTHALEYLLSFAPRISQKILENKNL